MIALKKSWLLIFFLLMISCSYAQNISWMLGTWKGTGNSKTSPFVRTLEIESISGNNFTGSRSKEANDHNHTKIVTAIAGQISKDTFYIKDGAIIFKKDPPHSKWFDCTQCTPFNKVIINEDSILLSSTTAGCQPLCNGTSVYFKLLPDFDTALQRSLVDMFGTPEQVEAFQPFVKIVPPIASSDPDAVQPDVAKTAAKNKQQYEDSLRLAGIANKKREQQILDSLRTEVEIARRRQQEMDDSLQNIAKQKQQQYDDSILVAKRRQQELQDSLQTALIAKKRQQQIDDSLQTVANIAKQKRQQEIDDSLNNAKLIAKQRQQQYDDSIQVAKRRQQELQDSLQTAALLAKKRQQQIDDSLQTVANIAKQKRQQEIDDSLNNAKLIAKQKQQQYDDSIQVAKKRQQELQDSLQTAALLAKKRQQQIDDSLRTVANIAKQKRQQEIDDSLNNAKLIAKQKQQQYDDSIQVAKKRQQELQDSLQTAALLAKKRQQQIDDSLQTVANIAKQKRQQQIEDSIKNADLIAKQKQQRYDDSVRVAKRREQRYADSLKLVAIIETQRRQQELADSLKNAAVIAKQRQQRYEDSVRIAQKRQQQIQDSLQNIANIAKIRKQEVEDSLRIAAGKKQPVTDTAKTIASKTQADKNRTLLQRDNVLLQTYHIKNPDILIELFDNAEIDGDRVSVFHNNGLIVNNQTLLREPITFKVHADSTNRMHEFILIAENLGTIPPNTALMRVTADNQVYKLSVKTDLKTNAKIVFYYDGN